MAVTIALWTYAAHQAFSQPTTDTNLRDLRRLENQFSNMREQREELRVVIEARFTKIETQLIEIQQQKDKFQNVGIAVVLTLAGLVMETVWGMIANRHKRGS